VLSNRDAAPYLYTKALFERNLRVLRDYEYCFIDLNGLTFEDRVVVRFDAKRFFEISSSGLRAIDLSEGRNVAYERNLAASENGLLPAESLVKLEWDFKRFVENEYTCDLSNIDDALESFETYLERGERKCLIPFVLRLNDFKEFEDSLYYIDYEDVLSNEHYVLELKDAPRRDFVYKPKVDMSFVFDPQARIAVVQCGLADQCFTTTEIRMLCDKYRLELYLEDLSYDVGLANHFMRLPLLQLTDNKISNRLFSTILSRKLRLRNKHCTKTIYQMFIYNWKNYGLKQLSAITNIDGMLNLPYAENELARNGIQLVRCDYSMDSGVSEYLGPAVYHIFAMDHQKIGYNSEVYKLKESFESYLRFPKIEQEDTQNTCLFEKMSKTDTVIVHVRRGDHVIGVWSQKKYSSNSVFKPTLERVYNSEEFAQYKNKLLVVLSDDIEFCKKHYGELGFGVAGENIIFVDWNHHYDSFRDMQIIAQGKVVIKFNGGFARCAALISKITEYVIHADDDGGKIEYQRNTESALKEL
jgi:hypothetical protein